MIVGDKIRLLYPPRHSQCPKCSWVCHGTRADANGNPTTGVADGLISHFYTHHNRMKVYRTWTCSVCNITGDGITMHHHHRHPERATPQPLPGNLSHETPPHQPSPVAGPAAPMDHPGSPTRQPALAEANQTPAVPPNAGLRSPPYKAPPTTSPDTPTPPSQWESSPLRSGPAKSIQHSAGAPEANLALPAAATRDNSRTSPLLSGQTMTVAMTMETTEPVRPPTPGSAPLTPPCAHQPKSGGRSGPALPHTHSLTHSHSHSQLHSPSLSPSLLVHGEGTLGPHGLTNPPEPTGPLTWPTNTAHPTSVTATMSPKHHSPTTPMQLQGFRCAGDPISNRSDTENYSAGSQPDTQSTMTSIFFNRWAPRIDGCSSLAELEGLVTACSSEWHSLTSVDGKSAPTRQNSPNIAFEGRSPQRRMNRTRQQQRARRGSKREQQATQAGRIQWLFLRYPRRAVCWVLGKTSQAYTGSLEDASAFLMDTYTKPRPSAEEVSRARETYDSCLWGNPTAEEFSLLATPPTAAEIATKISQATNTAPGADGIEYRDLAKLDPDGKLLDRLYEAVWRLEIPSSWKTARTTPIYKKGDPAQMMNYMPISLLSTIYKLFSAQLRPDFVPLPVAMPGFLPSKRGSCPAYMECRSTLCSWKRP